MCDVSKKDSFEKWRHAILSTIVCAFWYLTKYEVLCVYGSLVCEIDFIRQKPSKYFIRLNDFAIVPWGIWYCIIKKNDELLFYQIFIVSYFIHSLPGLRIHSSASQNQIYLVKLLTNISNLNWLRLTRCIYKILFLIGKNANQLNMMTVVGTKRSLPDGTLKVVQGLWIFVISKIIAVTKLHEI